MWSEEQKTGNAFPGGHLSPGPAAGINSPTEGQGKEKQK
jgi:hypothetical protein